jgi:hypothetical protein
MRLYFFLSLLWFGIVGLNGGDGHIRSTPRFPAANRVFVRVSA